MQAASEGMSQNKTDEAIEERKAMETKYNNLASTAFFAHESKIEYFKRQMECLTSKEETNLKTEALAELELGQSARNIAGARLLAERIASS